MPAIRLLSPCRFVSATIAGIRQQLRKLKLLTLGLFYNEHCDFFYATETCLNPAFWFVDNYVRHLGPIFVCVLISLVGAVVIIAYMIVIPYEIYQKSTPAICLYLTVGNWILVNTIFHYGKAWTTSPGHPPEGDLVVESVGVCKSCIAPKPPRTHHCRICGRCILQMDHHCPWLNQCVGHYNHRYFFFTMFYIWLGCLVIIIGMWPTFRDHYWSDSPVVAWCDLLYDQLFYAPMLCGGTGEVVRPLSKQMASEWSGGADGADDKTDTTDASTASLRSFGVRGISVHNAVLFEFFIGLAIVFGIGALMSWHALLITRGETSIEQHINSEMTKKSKREGRFYKNPYDFGPRQNWRIFLGLDVPGRTFWRHVLLPSAHLPSGDGLRWRSATYQFDDQPPPSLTVVTSVA
uniref:Palmitoyltransferase n=1 Tax=Plectus sambesii TaxID=2011161 RepID=A0A914VZB3_9BILA